MQEKRKCGHVARAQRLALGHWQRSIASLSCYIPQKAAAQANCSNRLRTSSTKLAKHPWRLGAAADLGTRTTTPACHGASAWAAWCWLARINEINALLPGADACAQNKQPERRRDGQACWDQQRASPGSTTPASCRRRFSVKRRVVTLS